MLPPFLLDCKCLFFLINQKEKDSLNQSKKKRTNACKNSKYFVNLLHNTKKDIMEAKLTEFKVKAYGKADLAMLYNPQMCAREALRTLTRWMVRNEELYRELIAIGYKKSCKILTPKEVGIIINYLGEP